MGQSGGDSNKRGNSRRWIFREVENSLRRLNTDWIDLYEVHRPDPDTAVEETLSALTDLQRQGKIRAHDETARITLGAVDVTLSTDTLDQIDAIVPPGVTLARADTGYIPPVLQDPSLRRRCTS